MGITPPNTRRAIHVKSGETEFLKVNAEPLGFRDLYNWLLILTWPKFFALLVFTYFAVNGAFALLYVVGGDCVDGMPAGSFREAFFFSVETLATVGYGHMYPSSLYGHMVSTIEIMTGMFGMALITGIIFVRFSRPIARVTFSNVLVHGPFDAKPSIMLRVANMRHHAMAEAEFRLMVIRDELIAEGDVLRRFYPLELQFDRLIAFPAVLTIRHIIDERSPLYGWTPADYERADTIFVTSVVCIDTSIPASVQTQRQYNWRDIRFGHRFCEVYTEVGERKLIVDYARIHHTEPYVPKNGNPRVAAS